MANPAPRKAAPQVRFPPAKGLRRRWGELPAHVRRDIERKVGAKIRHTRIATEGFSPAFAGVVTDARGRQTFLKVVGASPNREALEIYRQEVRNLRCLPEGLPTPRMLWHTDRDGWVTIAFEAVQGRTPRLPWRAPELARVFAAWSEVSRKLNPAPPGFLPFDQLHRNTFGGWDRIRAEGNRDGIRNKELDTWWRAHVSELAHTESTWPDASVGESLLHSDLRADNILVADGQIWFVDWPHACVGAAWLDYLLMLPSVSMQGGPRPW